MSQEQITTCPKCGYASTRPDVCEACGALLSRIRERRHGSDDAPFTPEAAVAQLSDRYDSNASDGRLTKIMLVLLVLGGIAFAAQHWLSSKPAPAKSSAYVHEFEDTLFDSEIVNAPAGQTWVVDFFATWCGPCKQFAPEFDATARTLGAKVSFARVNVDIASNTSQRYRIRSIPTVMMFRNGKAIAETGGMDRDNLGRWISSNL
jgi:thioredoxin